MSPKVFPVHDITMTSQWPPWRLKSPASTLFTQSLIQAQIKENVKAPRHWPLCREFTGTGEFPAQRACNAENVSIWWRHHAFGWLVRDDACMRRRPQPSSSQMYMDMPAISHTYLPLYGQFYFWCPRFQFCGLLQIWIDILLFYRWCKCISTI